MPDVAIRNFKPSEPVSPAGGSELRRTAYGIAIGEAFGSVGRARTQGRQLNCNPMGIPGHPSSGAEGQPLAGPDREGPPGAA